jgi:hypothetical protein
VSAPSSRRAAISSSRPSLRTAIQVPVPHGMHTFMNAGADSAGAPSGLSSHVLTAPSMPTTVPFSKSASASYTSPTGVTLTPTPCLLAGNQKRHPTLFQLPGPAQPCLCSALVHLLCCTNKVTTNESQVDCMSPLDIYLKVALS